MVGTTHVVGAGLAGLSAATALADAGRKVILHEAAGHAGGRCRSYPDRVLGMPIDNGNHIILSGNDATLGYLERIGTRDRVRGPATARFAFFDLASNERWEVDFGNGRLPWWVFDRRRRVPATRARDYLSLAPLSMRPGSGTVADVTACPEPLYGRLIQPLLLATLNNEPQQASARLAAKVIRETVARGGRGCRPLIARDGLSAAFVDPALSFLERCGGSVHFGSMLRNVRYSGDLVEALDFGTHTIEIEAGDTVVAAVPAEAAARLFPDLITPVEFRSIANIHFRVEAQDELPPMIGIVNGLSQWAFQFAGRISVTISNADALSGIDREALARKVWSEIMQIVGEARPLPPWQIVHERRATFATVPRQEERRPAARTRWKNLFLAGDWIATGLPPTIESAVRSGHRAAELAAAGDRLHAYA